MTSRSLQRYRKHLARGWSESTLCRWWTGIDRAPGVVEMAPGSSAAVLLLWVLVLLAIS